MAKRTPKTPKPRLAGGQQSLLNHIYWKGFAGQGDREFNYATKDVRELCFKQGLVFRTPQGRIQLTEDGYMAISKAVPVPLSAELETFVELVRTTLISGGDEYFGELRMEKTSASSYRSSATRTLEPHLYAEWSTGGVEGGSCWDSSNPQPYSTGKPEADLSSLDFLLETLCPDISFLTYKRLCRELVTHGSRQESEYYGNHTNYSSKEVKLNDLRTFLRSIGVKP